MLSNTFDAEERSQRIESASKGEDVCVQQSLVCVRTVWDC